MSNKRIEYFVLVMLLHTNIVIGNAPLRLLLLSLANQNVAAVVASCLGCPVHATLRAQLRYCDTVSH